MFFFFILLLKFTFQLKFCLLNKIFFCIDKVINPEPVKLKPNGQPVDPTYAIRNQNIVTRFVSEFGLEQEVLQLQNTVNGVILSINNFLGEGPQKPNPDRIGNVQL